MKQNSKFHYFLFLIISIYFTFINSQFENIEMTNDTFIIKFSTEEALKFNISGVNSSYLQIITKGTGEPEFTNHIISYYENEILNERKQLSQSITDETVMWLTKEQIKNNFFITVECAITPCNFSLELTKKEVAELFLNEQYSYYITEQNEEMKFKLLEKEKKTEGEYQLEIWSKGNYYINTSIEEKGSIRKNDNFFYINYTDFSNHTFYLNIKAKIGDFVNIGSILFKKDNEKLEFKNDFKIENGLEISDFIDRTIIHTFEINKNNYILNYYKFNNEFLYSFSNDDNLFFEEEYNQSYYSIQFLKDTKYDKQGNNKYFPLINGIYYPEKIQEGTTIGLIPMKPEDSFNYLTYEVLPYYGDINVSIYKCDNYPLCHINEQALQNSEKITDFYKSYYKIYSKVEWIEDITPISKNQNMLLITCNKGISDQHKFCSSFINMKTDTKIVDFTTFGKRYFPTQKFIKKNSEENYLMTGENSQRNIYVETFSGDIDVKIEPSDKTEKYEYDNKQLYIIPENIDITIKIKAKENSIYLIYDSAIKLDDKLLIGSNYFFNLTEENKGIPISFYEDIPFDSVNQSINYNYILNIYYLNCPLNFKYQYNPEISENISSIDLINKNDFHQLTISTKDNLFSSYVSKINSTQSTHESCLFYISAFKKEIITDEKINGIPLAKSISNKFIFNKENDKMIFSFSYIEKEKDIKINFNTLKEGNYKVEFKIDNNLLETGIIPRTHEIILKSREINLNNTQLIKQILLYVELIGKEKDSILEIIFNTDKQNNDDDDNSKHKKLVIILVTIVIILLIIIVVVFYILLKTKCKNRDLIKAIDQISFQDSKKDDEEVRESLLE